MSSLTERLKDHYDRLWSAEPWQLAPWQRSGVFALRMMVCVGRDLARGELNLRAMSLVYTTLLSLVPLLALSFSVLKGFGVHNQLEPLLLGYFEPMGPEGAEVAQQIIGFVENIKVGVLGSVGLGLLIYTVISLLQKIESAFNFVWRVTRLRSIAERFSRFLSVLMVGPLLVFSAVGLTATVMSNTVVQQLIAIEPFGSLILGVGKLLPYLLVTLAFTFVYSFIPNTRVRLGPALLGGLVGGLMWQSTGWGFAAFIANSSNYAAVYSGFAIIILMLIWLYLSWLVLLIGAQVAYYAQNPRAMSHDLRTQRLSHADSETLSLVIYAEILRRFDAGSPPVTIRDLETQLHISGEALEQSIANLVDAGVLIEVPQRHSIGLLPARDPSAIPLAELLLQLRRAGRRLHWRPEAGAQAAEAMARAERAVAETLGDTDVRQLAAIRPTELQPPSPGRG